MKWEGDGSSGELARPRMSVVVDGGGVDGRVCDIARLAGRVWERWRGARRRLFVTLGGISSVIDSKRLSAGACAAL